MSLTRIIAWRRRHRRTHRDLLLQPRIRRGNFAFATLSLRGRGDITFMIHDVAHMKFPSMLGISLISNDLRIASRIASFNHLEQVL
jgi:hypothetical protein